MNKNIIKFCIIACILVPVIFFVIIAFCNLSLLVKLFTDSEFLGNATLIVVIAAVCLYYKWKDAQRPYAKHGNLQKHKQN